MANYGGYSQSGYGQPDYGHSQAVDPRYAQRQPDPRYAEPQPDPRYAPSYQQQPAASTPSTGNYRWWIPASGIRRDVITADIQRYLGQDALVKPGEGTGENRGQPGYWIAAYRNLTSSMIADLKNDSTNFERSGARGRYEESQVHESRQYYGSTDHQRGAIPSRESTQSTATVASYGSGTSASSHGYPGQRQPAGQPQPVAVGYGHAVTSSPTTDPNYITGGYGNAGSNPGYAAPRQDDRNPRYAEPRHEVPRGYEAPPTQQPLTRNRTPPGYYRASDNNCYPLSQQPGYRS